MSFNEYYNCNVYVSEECPNAIKIENPTADYNCHFYAWYSQDINVDSDDLHWIPTPDVFINEDQHRVYIGNQDDVENGLELEYGTIATYWIGSEGNRICVHSAYVIDVDSQGNVTCESKWGKAGLYEHALDEVPWIYLNIETGFTPDVEYYSYVQGEHDLTYSSIDHDEHFTDCRDCDYSVYESHSNKYVSVSATEHRSTCSDCGHVGYDSHNEQYTYINSGEHRVNCSTCGYSSYEDHDLYIETIYGEDNGCDVACRDCSYSFHCDCDPEYASDGSDGHYVGCPDGEFSFFEAHTLRYTRVIGDLYNHSVSCTGCDYTYSEGHSWVWNSTTQKYVCSGCGYITDEDSVPGIMSLPDPELEAYLASLSDEELEEFIASLPEDQMDRVTALLPSDDEHLAE